MIDWNKPVRTKDGREVRVLCTDRVTDSSYPVLALVKDGCGYEAAHSYTIEGKYRISGTESKNDLENVPEVKSIWVNVYPDDVYGYRSRKEADFWPDFWAEDDRVALLRLDIQDGILIGMHIEG